MNSRSTARHASRDSLWVALTYALAAAVWVLLSDRVVASLGLPDPVNLVVSSTKGLAFVVATSAILYLVLVRRLSQLYASQLRSTRLFERAAEGLMVITVERDEQGSIRDLVVSDANPVMADRFAMPRESLVGRRKSTVDPHDRRVNAYFCCVSDGARSGEIVRDDADLGDGVYELLVAYPVEEDVWILAAMDISALRGAQTQLKHQEEKIRQAYVDVLDAVTGGKLVVMTDDEIDEELGLPLTAVMPLESPQELADARHTIRQAVAQYAPQLSESTELLSAVGEALNNALKHAQRGEYRVFVSDGRIQVCVSDAGPGIDFRTLPKATLVPGFSTAQTLGMGFTIMLQLSDRVLLSTKPGQTEVVIEMTAA